MFRVEGAAPVWTEAPLSKTPDYRTHSAGRRHSVRMRRADFHTDSESLFNIEKGLIAKFCAQVSIAR